MNEIGNPNYKFLFTQNSEENNYYRWRVFSLFQGDSLTAWRKDPFQMFIGGPIWVPPPFNNNQTPQQNTSINSNEITNTINDKSEKSKKKIKENFSFSKFLM